MSSKAALKAVRAALESKDYQAAAEKAKEIVKNESTNYHANVFLGLASDRLNRNNDAENAYSAATDINPNDKTAWQGLISLYEKQGGCNHDGYHKAVIALGKIFADNDEKERCQDLINKYTKTMKNKGTSAQHKHALELQIPGSPLYDFLEGRLPRPSQTYQRLIEITERQEREFINREIGERRTRLGARIEQVTQEVRREAANKSRLDQFYQGMIDWTNDDTVRRQYEEKLFQRAYEELGVLPDAEKEAKRAAVFKAAHDMVIIKHPFEPAWKVFLGWLDVQELSQYDVGHLREYIEFFPESGLSQVLKGFLLSELSPFPHDPSDETNGKDSNDSKETSATQPDNEIDDAKATPQDPLVLMVEGLDSARDSILAHRIMADVYLSFEEYESVVNVARKGLLYIENLVRYSGIKIPNTVDALKNALANAMIHYQSPRHHTDAKRIFEGILERNPTSSNCLLGIGLILKEDQDYAEAVNFLRRSLERDSANLKIRGELAWCEALSGDLEGGLKSLQATLEDLKEAQPDNREFKSELFYRIGYCQWELDPSPAARKDRSGAYASLFASIQANMNFAPAYTILGFYYADYKKDKVRARRCFHKAFELSTSEIEAAERLAKGFADSKEWDLVEAIAQRVVDSGKARPSPGSKRRGFSWPYAALGSVQVNKQQYSKSVVSFQAALRLAPTDYHSWVGLAESYHHSGRYNAATRAFEQAKSLEPELSAKDKEHVWFARYMLANVRRELGQYDDAIAAYEDVLRSRPDDIGVTLALLQTLTESSAKSLGLGLFNDAAELAYQAISVASSLVQIKSNIFNLWKAVGDAFSNFSYMKAKAGKLPASSCKALLAVDLDPMALDVMTDIDGVGTDWLAANESEELIPSELYVRLSIIAFKRALHVSVHDAHSQAVAWYNLGWAEYLTHRTVHPDTTKKGKKSRKFIKAAMRCFKRAIELEAGNADFWNSLGIVTANMSPKVSQHAFVRSLHLNERNAQVWTNLGALYLLHGKGYQAYKTFLRAQATDPDYSLAWVGQGFVSLDTRQTQEARGYFEHAFDISNSSDILTKRQFSLAHFDHLNEASSSNVSELIQPFFALHQLCIQDPSNLPFVHLSALLAERMGETADAESSLQVVCLGMEDEFEKTESPASLSRYAQANADMARVLLARHSYEEAAEKAELALTLSGEEDAENFDPEACKKLRLSAHLTAGLAFYNLKSMDQAIDMFRDALEEAQNAPDVVCLLAQVLWAKGGEENRSVAREQLLDCVMNHSSHIGAVTLLGAIALLDADRDAIEAVESDLNSMISRNDIDLHDRAKIIKLLNAISAMGLNDNATVPESIRRIGDATAAVMLTPGQSAGWMELSAASRNPYPAAMAINRALQSVPPYSNLGAEDLSEAYAQTGKVGDTFRAIMIAPWKSSGWEQLSHIVPIRNMWTRCTGQKSEEMDDEKPLLPWKRSTGHGPE
ncbi:Translation repressor/antiviral protein Ski3, putative [Penicillium digitatum]|uniref:Translation repressor/antiviral protein Ski3, putative n=3 Tax=Penicillium digitatum TaxID=36651 RepID=K9GX99_PEND2|nr:Translation repressor/antiviral protein Ski3, putative [Penicillium digitatum Pd1]EKV19233.1 Translation repressor/antiviral protein Ski3, putative [Penicillium digitatum PHI26]EKV21193.1 Translation repressor/antiviral protein Ski3, putative [Penicillium digitatum Pd1]QQK48135.1 Translation repressor/antiviral protein Ski3, putative [Penicillium digitatum]